MKKRDKNLKFFQYNFFPKNHSASSLKNSFFPKNHKGQFYLISTIIIIAIIVGFATVANYCKKKEFTRIYDLKEELEIESKNVLDYIAINRENKLPEFTKNFSEYAGQEIEIIYITGSPENIEAYKYVNGTKESVSITKEGDIIKVPIDDIEYEFKVKTGENFYFIISEEIGEEKYIITN